MIEFAAWIYLGGALTTFPRSGRALKGKRLPASSLNWIPTTMTLSKETSGANGRATNRNLTRMPPHNRDAERALLGAMLRDNNIIAEAVGLASAADCYTVAHGIIFRAILDLHNTGKPADIVTVGERLFQSKLMEEIGGPGYLADLFDAAPSAGNFRHYAEIIREQAKRRRLIHSCGDLAEQAYDP